MVDVLNNALNDIIDTRNDVNDDQTEVILDSREPALLNALLSKESMTSIVSSRQLDVGDVLMRRGHFEILLERKTTSDLAASITDGRYREQKARLVAWRQERPSDRTIAYIVESAGFSFDIDRTHAKFRSIHKSIVGSIINTAFRDGVLVLCVSDLDETAHLLTGMSARMSSLLAERRIDTGTSAPAAAVNQGIQVRKKDNCGGARGCLLRQLSQIPGISEKKATSIIDATGATSMGALVQRLAAERQDPTASTSFLASVPGIGRKLVDAINAALFD